MSTDAAVAVLDGFPISEGHSLIIPKRHVELLFELPEDELSQTWSLVAKVRELLKRKYSPDGVNEGAAAGQTISHAHIRSRRPPRHRESNTAAVIVVRANCRNSRSEPRVRQYSTLFRGHDKLC
jgi:diadenosine tetraphosphate (Ap4A) HIT family hydrolase